MPERKRTIYGALYDYKYEWGIILVSLSINEMFKHAIEGYIPLNPVLGHALFAVLILILWALSDKVEVEANEDSRFWK